MGIPFITLWIIPGAGSANARFWFPALDMSQGREQSCPACVFPSLLQFTTKWRPSCHIWRTTGVHNGLKAGETCRTRRYKDPYDQEIFNRLSYRSEEHTSELKSLLRISYAVFSCTKK